jgi:hypothetical protein
MQAVRLVTCLCLDICELDVKVSALNMDVELVDVNYLDMMDVSSSTTNNICNG